jgi:hypothetical protein
MAQSSGWTILHKRYGAEIRQPSHAELADAISELFDEHIIGMTEADYAEHPAASLRYGFDDGPMFLAEARRNKTVTLARYADQDDVDPVAAATYNVDRSTLLFLWQQLAEGNLEQVRSAFPGCGW